MKPLDFFTAVITAIMLGLGSVALADEHGEMQADTMTVNVNEADAATIANTLVGVGISRARAIVDYREKHGRFYSPEELTAVKGIGNVTVEMNLSRIIVQ